MPLVHLYSRMIPRAGDDHKEPPFVLWEVCDPLEYEGKKHREEMVATILLENGVEPGRLYEGQLWKVTEEDDLGKETVLGWFAGGKWSTQRLKVGEAVYASVKDFMKELTHHAQVVLAVECARSVIHLVPENETRPKQSIYLVDRWLSEGTLTESQLKSATFASYQAAGDNSSNVASNYACSSAADASYATYAGSQTSYAVGASAEDAKNAISSILQVQSVIRRCLLQV